MEIYVLDYGVRVTTVHSFVQCRLGAVDDAIISTEVLNFKE